MGRIKAIGLVVAHIERGRNSTIEFPSMKKGDFI
jgi:hypothetical protein